MAENKNQEGHVYYFEPNDTSIGKDQDGYDVPLMPHLEDLCISMSLTADIFPREKNSIHSLSKINDATIVQRKISWISYINQDSGATMKSSYQMTSSGTEMGDDRFLTTYYSEISADKYIDNEIVEGLGVTSVNISFESWYTPTITINFIDVHGSALWGREEAIHDNGDITSSNILGVFFTQPYPLFRLQIKGFLGQAVTYQLSVSSFKGRYNSTTGNFEATATFIGYNYSLLADVPLSFLTSVPITDYVGKSYWDNHINSPSWQLHNADGTTCQPIPLYLLIENIRSAIGSLDSMTAKNCQGVEINVSSANSNGTVGNATEKDQIVSLEGASTVTGATQGNSELGAIKQALDDFVKQCRIFCEGEKCGKFFIGRNGTEHQMLFLFGTPPGVRTNPPQLQPKDALRQKYVNLVNLIKGYNEAHPSNKFVNGIETKSPDFHKKAIECKKGDLWFNVKQIFKVSGHMFGRINNNNTTYLPFNAQFENKSASVVSNTKIKDLKINSHTLMPNTASQLEEHFNLFNRGGQHSSYVVAPIKNGKGFGEYASLIDIGNMYYELDKRIGINTNSSTNIQTATENKIANQSNGAQTVNISSSSNEQDQIIEETRKLKIVKLIGFEPTIGNFVKLVMCHLETFVETMFVCAENIYKDLSNRTTENMGVGLEDTDITDANSTPSSAQNNTESKPIFPWPALYNPKFNGTNSECVPSNAKDGKSEVLGCPLDYPTKYGYEWEEAKVVLSYIDSISRIKEYLNSQHGKLKGNSYGSIPMSGSDLTTLTSPFRGIGTTWKEIESLSAYLGLRMAQLIGVGDNKCNAEIAEAIGSIDALNLIQANIKPEELKEVVNIKDGNQNFADRVIDYLTCDNNSKNSTETERGNSYNIFELSSKGTYYHPTRHPMYIKVDNNTYKYSYLYTLNESESISLVPTELHSFIANGNPYSKVVTSSTASNGKIHYKMNVDKSGNQFIIYTCNSKELLPSDVNDFINEQLFTIVGDQFLVDSLRKEIKMLKDGTLNINNYSPKGADKDENVKNFIERRYQISDKEYSHFFFDGKNYHMIAPKLESVDETYSKDKTIKLNGENGDVRLDKKWCYDTSSDIYKKLTFVKDGNEIKFKNSGKSFEASEMNVVDLPIMTNSEVVGSLFGSKLYYLQNELENDEFRNIAKAYLVISSLMSGIEKPEESFFKGDERNIIKAFPPFYILFLGSLIWRKSLGDGIDLCFGEYKDNCPSKDETFISKTKQIMYIDTQNKMDWYTLSDFYMDFDKIDISVKNKLLTTFLTFAKGKLMTEIIHSFELTTNENKVIKNEDWKNIVSKWSDSSFKSELVDSWKTIFGDSTKKMLMFALPENKQCVRLMFQTENNRGVEILTSLYGLTSPYIVGRATTKMVGLGDNQVTLSKEQMKSYLNGFEKRLKDINVTDKKEEKKIEAIAGKTIYRDFAVEMYYSLKHIWDTWLITSARNQFKIEEFFNKYFVFMDSFYTNVYNEIKLDAENILKAFNKDKQNLLTFITDVTSLEHCMFFSLPDFIDSNVYDTPTVGYYAARNNKTNFSWKREDLDKLFTPIPYNEMRPPQVQNVFVFIYTHPFSDNALENTDKRFDSYMMNDPETWPNALKAPLVGEITANADRMKDDNDKDVMVRPNNSIPNASEELVSGRHGYMMPCFGVTVNRGNNYIFKSINVNMESPKITAISAQTLENILTKTGADGSKRIFFYGQDIYSIYSQYAYSCEIEMMGCAQIQPLMYFQLLNIPMWRGTYMIYKVTHNMTPGNMTTKFVGMKMSRKQAPYATGYFAVGKESSKPQITVNGNVGGNGNENGQGGTQNNMTVDGNGFNGKVTNERMKKVMSRINHVCIQGKYNDEKYWRNVRNSGCKKYQYDCPERHCTCGPATWYHIAGLSISFWSSPKTANHNNTKLVNSGFKMVWHGTVEAYKALKKDSFRIGDIATMYANYASGGPTSHACMYCGNGEWRSDFVQRGGAWVYRNGKGRDGDYSVCIWRHPEFQEPGLTA